MHRRTLPIVSPCDRFEPAPGRTFCSHCRLHVHDISGMTAAEAEAFVATRPAGRTCVAYRTAADGTILHRARPRRFALAAAVLGHALGLAACAGHAVEATTPGEACRDPQGFEVDCERARLAAVVVIPDDDARIDDAPPAERDDGDLVVDETAGRHGEVDAAEVADEPSDGEPPVAASEYDEPVGAVAAGGAFFSASMKGAVAESVEVGDVADARKARRAERRAAKRVARTFR